MTSGSFKEIAEQLEARGAVTEAQQLQKITDQLQVMVPAKVVEAVRILKIVQAEASKDPALVNVAARASLLSHRIQAFYAKR